MNDDIFKYPDTNSSRAKIEYLNRKFKDQKIAIIGLGGTGSYILDLVSKTPVKEIHIYDGDVFELHTAFRAPGAIDGAKLDAEPGLKKVKYYYDVYSKMHGGIIPHDEYFTEHNLKELNGFDCVFVSVDKNKARSMIARGLLSMKVPFIDVGLGVNMHDDSLMATIRVTMGTKRKNNHLRLRIGEDETEENEYAPNIQIADLNCMNAVLAVIRWKKMIGFYHDLKHEHHTLYLLNTNKLINDDHTT